MEINKAHGSPYERGEADSYYRRQFRPNKWLDPLGVKRTEDLTDLEIAEYRAGYDRNELTGDHKEYGRDDDVELPAVDDWPDDDCDDE